MTSAPVGSGELAKLWSRYVSHFNFTQLGWLFDTFQEECDNDVIADLDTLCRVIEGWLGYQWPAILRKVNADLLRESLEGFPLPLDFGGLIDFMNLYQEKHIEEEEHAGFDNDNVNDLQALYDQHNGMSCGDGLKGKALFAVLEDLGVVFHSSEERAWYVEIVTKFDRDASGTINFAELCQIIRKVINMEEDKNRARQFELVKQSGLPFHEVEDWNHLFITKDTKGSGELQLGEVKTLIVNIGVKWDRETSDQIIEWIAEGDANNNGTIDFGEFCLVISKMWAANLHDIKGAARNLMVKDRTVSLKSVHGTYLAAGKDGSCSAPRTEAGEAETFIMKRNPDNGCICLQSRHGKFIKVTESDVACNGDTGTDFKLTTQEDERIILTTTGALGGHLFVHSDGKVQVSDGNPADIPFTIFSVVSHEELHKKCWSKSVSSKPKIDIKEARKRSKEGSTPRMMDPLSPGMSNAIANMDAALDNKALLSARGMA